MESLYTMPLRYRFKPPLPALLRMMETFCILLSSSFLCSCSYASFICGMSQTPIKCTLELSVTSTTCWMKKFPF